MSIQPENNETPLDFVTGALDCLPDDPAQASVEDVEVLGAISAGLTRRALEANGQQAQLAMSVLEGTDLAAAQAEDARLRTEFASLQAADVLLTDYIRAAVAARGHNLDALVAAAEGRGGGQP